MEVAHDEVMGPAHLGYGVGDTLHQFVLHQRGGLPLQIFLRREPKKLGGFAHYSHSMVAGGLEVMS